MVYHAKQKRTKKAEKATSFMTKEDSEKHSWLQRRTQGLVKAAHPDGNSFTQEFWSECYRQAVKEWEEKWEKQERA